MAGSIAGSIVYCESFSSKLQEELLAREIFYDLREAKAQIETWKDYDNTTGFIDTLARIEVRDLIAAQGLLGGKWWRPVRIRLTSPPDRSMGNQFSTKLEPPIWGSSNQIASDCSRFYRMSLDHTHPDLSLIHI